MREKIELTIEGNIEDNVPEGFIFVNQEPTKFDQEKGNVTYTVIIKRISDNKFFRGKCVNWRFQVYDWEDVWTETYRKEKTVYVYE